MIINLRYMPISFSHFYLIKLSNQSCNVNNLGCTTCIQKVKNVLIYRTKKSIYFCSVPDPTTLPLQSGAICMLLQLITAQFCGNIYNPAKCEAPDPSLTQITGAQINVMNKVSAKNSASSLFFCGKRPNVLDKESLDWPFL